MKFILQQPKEFIVQWFKNLRIKYRNPTISIKHPILFQYDDIDAIEIGENVCLSAFSEIVVCAKTNFSKKLGRLTIETGVSIGSQANIRAAGGEIFIGRNSIIGQGVSLIASNHNISLNKTHVEEPWDERKTGVYVGENVWIGAGVIVLPGCIIGKNSVIGAGSVVTKNVPANEIYLGIPARKHKSIENTKNQIGINTST